MSRSITIVLCLITSVIGMTTFSGEASPQRTVTVLGTSSIDVEADYVVLTAEIEVRAKSMDEVRKIVEEKSTSALDYARSFGIPKDDTVVLGAYTRPSYKNNDEGTDPLFYISSKGLEFTLRDVSKYGEFVSGLRQHGITNIISPWPRNSKEATYRDQMYAKAMKEAHNRASLLAAQEASRVGKVVRIEDESANERNRYLGSGGVGGSTRSDETLRKITIAASVIVTYELE